MATKPSKTKKPAKPKLAPAPDLSSIRAHIDGIDLKIQTLIQERAQFARQVGAAKGPLKAAVEYYRPEREAQVLRRVVDRNAGPLADDVLVRLFREVMSACLAQQEPLRVGYLGPEGTFSQQAVHKHFGHSARGLPLSTIEEVFEEVEAGNADFGVVPVENSSEGVVTRSLDLFLTTPLTIIGETSLYVRHNVLRKVDSLDGIAAVCAHPQALAQCHAWLSHHLPNAERRPVASNAEGARLAGLDPALAALASERAASEYGLFIVAPAVQDDAHNRTRFAIVAHPGQHPPPKASGHDCTSLVVSVANRPGAVHDMLQPLKAHGVSMTRFESRPARSGQWEYYFYVDLDGHPDQPNVSLALKELHDACAFFKLLGTYPVDSH